MKDPSSMNTYIDRYYFLIQLAHHVYAFFFLLSKLSLKIVSDTIYKVLF